MELELKITCACHQAKISNATGCPNCSKNLHRVVFQHAESKFAIRFALRLLKQYKL